MEVHRAPTRATSRPSESYILNCPASTDSNSKIVPLTRSALISLNTTFAVTVTNAPVSGLVWVSTNE